MGTAALTLGIVGLFTWFFPPLGISIGIVGLILGILTLVVSKQQKRRAVAGIVMCILGIVLSIGVIVSFITAGLIIEGMFPEYFRY